MTKAHKISGFQGLFFSRLWYHINKICIDMSYTIFRQNPFPHWYYSVPLFYSYQTSIPSYQVCDLKQIHPPQTLQTHTTWRHFPGFWLLLPIPTSCYLFREAIDPRRICRTQGCKHSVNRVGEGTQILGVFTASGVTPRISTNGGSTTGKLFDHGEIHGSPKWRFNIMLLFTVLERWCASGSVWHMYKSCE